MKHLHRTLLAGGSGLIVGLLGNLSGAIAAEKVVLTYGFLSMDIPIADLESFAAGEESSGELDQLFNLAGQNPETMRDTLNDPVPISPVVLDLVLNSPPGEWMLDRVSESIHPAAGGAGRLALRSALIGSAASDNEITLLEVMQVYPSPAIVVRGDRLLETYNSLYEVLEPLEGLIDIFRTVGESID